VSWLEALFQTWQAFSTVGYGNAPANTSLGKIQTMIFSTIGIFLLGAVFSLFMDVKEHFSTRRRVGLAKNKYKDFVLIVNFNLKNVLRIIEEYRVVDLDIPFCIVDENLDELPLAVKLVPKMWFVKGHILSESTYDLANIMKAKIAIVLPTDTTVQGDYTTKAVVDFLDNLNPQCRIIYLLNDYKNRKLFKENGKVSILRSSWVYLLVQECTDRYSSRVIEQITTNKHGENTITVQPDYFIDRTWKSLVLHALNSEWKITPLALIRNSKILAPPENDMVFCKNDYISIVAYLGFDWKAFEQYAQHTDLTTV